MWSKACVLGLFVALAIIGGLGTARAADDASAPINYGPGRLVCNLANSAIRESSGVAFGWRQHQAAAGQSVAENDVFWTHNDSGNPPQLYAFDRRGTDLGAFTIEGATNVDWEDMASFQLHGTCYLLVADVGDNAERRTDCALYVVEEPRVDRRHPAARATIPLKYRIRFRYEDGAHNCESVAVDPATATVYLLAKEQALVSRLYALPLKADEQAVARRVGKVTVTLATAMCFAPDGSRVVVLTYGSASEYRREGKEPWEQAFTRTPRILAMPAREQGEAICCGADGRTLYLTSELRAAKTGCPFYEVPVLPVSPAR